LMAQVEEGTPQLVTMLWGITNFKRT
jgi:hypothetical protein